MRAVTLLSLCGVAAAAPELTPENFDEVVFGGGKSAFIKFLEENGVEGIPRFVHGIRGVSS